MEVSYDGSLWGLFSLLDKIFKGGPLPDRVRRGVPRNPACASGAGLSPDIAPAPPASGQATRPAGQGTQPDLFGPFCEPGLPCPLPESRKRPGDPPPGISGTYPGDPLQWEGLVPFPYPAAGELFAVSANAYGYFLYGWMSEFPIEAELLCFARRVMTAARRAGETRPGGLCSPEARRAAERALSDRGRAEVRTVLEAARKVWRESDRLMGLLRFRVFPGNIHIARCAPDHLTIPSLAGHFTRRFGEIPWAIIDEKRRLTLSGIPGGPPCILFGNAAGPEPGEDALSSPAAGKTDPWEELWRNYHRSINNEGRNNPQLQKQFMPVRYWKYLSELTPPGS